MRGRIALGALLVVAAAALMVSCGDDDDGGGSRKPSGAAGRGGAGGEGGSGGAGGSGGSGGSGGDEKPRTIDVEGKVIHADGGPVLGAFVFLDEDFENHLLTDADGRFTARSVESPYTLTVLSGDRVVHLVGLANAEPVIVATSAVRLEDLVQFEGEADLEPPIPDGESLACAVAEPHACALEWDKDTGSFSVDLTIVGGLEREGGDLLFLHTSHPDDTTTEFLGAARVAELDFGSDVAQAGLEAKLTLEVPTFEASLTVDPGAYDGSVAAILRSYTVEGVTFYQAHQVPIDKAFDVPAEGGVVRVLGRDKHGVYAQRSVRLEKGKMEVRLPETSMMRILRPKPDAVVSASPELEWTRVEGAHSYYVTVHTAGSTLTAVLPGDRTSLRIPDLRAYGIPHALGQSVNVLALPPESKIDPEVLSNAGMGSFGLSMMESGTYFAAGLTFSIED